MENNQTGNPIRPEVMKKILSCRLFEDEFLNAVCHDNIECTQLILQIILDKPDLVVKSSRTQVTLKNLHGRSLRLDVVSTDSTGVIHNIEVQRASKGANPRRARYHGALLDANMVEPGEKFENIPETHIVFITEEDFFKVGLPLYEVEKKLKGTDITFDDGMHIVYVNGAYRGQNKIGDLMHDFSCSNPDDMIFPILADRARYFKRNEGGIKQMSEMMENMVNEETIKVREEIARNLLKTTGLSHEEIAKNSGLSLERVLELAGEKTA